MCSRTSTTPSTGACWDNIPRLRQELDTAEAVVIGAGSGLSASAGFTYAGERFQKYFGDFIAKYGFRDMYSGGFYPFETPEEHWAYWSRYIYINRCLDPPKPVYNALLELVKDKDYFVITTNVDHCFQKAGFDKRRLFYTQGDYGLWQCSRPCHKKTYDNTTAVRQMLEAQGFRAAEDLVLTEGSAAKTRVPSALVPRCPVCGAPMAMNLRSDATFVEDAGWHAAARRYEAFLRRRQGRHILFLELGVGGNTPVIIKYPFWKMTFQNPRAVYACVNLGQAYCPKEIRKQAICIDGDIGCTLRKLEVTRGCQR